MTKDTEDLLKFVQKLIREGASEEVTTDTELFDGGHLNSMNILDLVGFIEEKIDRKLSDEELVMKNFKSVSTIESIFFVK